MQETLGSVIKKAREDRKLTLQKIEQETGVPLRHLESFESDVFIETIPEAYALAYLRKITPILGVPYETLRSLYVEMRDSARYRVEKDGHERINKRDRFYFSRDTSMTFFVMLVVIGFLGYQAYNYFRSPFLFLSFPEDNMISNGNQIEVRGVTEVGVSLKINGEAVEKNDKQEFISHYFLIPGVNILDVVAERRFGKKLHIRRTIMYNP